MTDGYIQKKIDQDPAIDTDASNKWLDQRFSAHIEGFICATQVQELNTKVTRKRREKDQAKKQSMDVRCRVCQEYIRIGILPDWLMPSASSINVPPDETQSGYKDIVSRVIIKAHNRIKTTRGNSNR